MTIAKAAARAMAHIRAFVLRRMQEKNFDPLANLMAVAQDQAAPLNARIRCTAILLNHYLAAAAPEAPPVELDPDPRAWEPRDGEIPDAAPQAGPQAGQAAREAGNACGDTPPPSYAHLTRQQRRFILRKAQKRGLTLSPELLQALKPPPNGGITKPAQAAMLEKLAAGGGASTA